ncbi:hypothetical protein DEO72_LG7g955 [Vigna unguiculata]|uniref:Uncharacterized protein n=1 Tax=Vigna unguiculata TaxID=3917 RepID=A0A4D6MGN4_VIGUN|nr:hypothetical protein DEO72_LG7g955 [Vigna unguiculata]
MDSKCLQFVDCSEEKKIFFCHSCKAKYIGALNDKLSVQQKEYIAGTPFWWFTMLKELVKIIQVPDEQVPVIVALDECDSG